MSTPHTESALRQRQQPLTPIRDEDLTAQIEPFDSFWEAPDDIEKGYRSFATFYKHNYLTHVPDDRQARILVISCGPGYFVNLLVENGYQNVAGIDSIAEKVRWAEERGLNCRVSRLFAFFSQEHEAFDLIFAEQEINHLTKREILAFLSVCWDNLKKGGRLIVHSINGANPLTGSESRAGNFDHYNSFTEYSLKQILEYANFRDVRIVPLNLYVFYRNPLNYIALLIYKLNSLFFRINFMLAGKSAKVFTKKIAAVASKVA